MYCIIPNRQFTCKGGYLSQVVPRKCCCLHDMEFFEAYSNVYCRPVGGFHKSELIPLPMEHVQTISLTSNYHLN